MRMTWRWHAGKQEEKEEWPWSKWSPPPSNEPESSVCSPRGVEPADRELWIWQRWVPLFCLHKMSSSSMRRGEAWGQTPRQTDRQTAGSPALWSWNSSRFSQEVVAHWDASPLRNNKVSFYRPKHTGTSAHRPGAGKRAETECVDCACQLCRIHVLKAAWTEIKLKETVLINQWPQTVYSYSVRSGWPLQPVLHANWWLPSASLRQCHQDDIVYNYCSWQF